VEAPCRSSATSATRCSIARAPDGRLAYAHPRLRGRPRFDDVAVSAPGRATWFARLVAPVRFRLPSGRGVDAVLVRWYEAAAPLRAVAPSAARAAVAACPRLRPGDPGLDWCLPAQLLRRVTLAPDWSGPADTSFVNVFLEQLAPAGAPIPNGRDGDGEGDDDDGDDDGDGGGSNGRM